MTYHFRLNMIQINSKWLLKKYLFQFSKIVKKKQILKVKVILYEYVLNKIIKNEISCSFLMIFDFHLIIRKII